MTGMKYDYTNMMLTMNYTMQQVSLRRGLELYGERGDIAAYEEMKQQHLRDRFKPMLPSSIPSSKRKEVLESLMLLSEKSDGSIKGQNCANVSKQRNLINKEGQQVLRSDLNLNY